MSKRANAFVVVGNFKACALCVVLALVATSAANGAWGLPAPPDWFVAPPDGATRLQHHSFHADPNLNQGPEDWTIDGFVPSQPDRWAMPPGIQYNVPNPSPWAFYWENGGGGAGIPMPGGFLNDNIGATLPNGGTLTKTMGNLANDRMIKEFYALVIWTGSPGQLNMSVSSPGTTVTNTFTYENGEAGMLATIIEGTIKPQPDFEDFSFAFRTTAFIDEIYVGTHCVPEPSTIALLLMGAIGLFGLCRRRARR